MNPETEQRVLESAKYLRRVRPLDPAELAQYVDQPVDREAVAGVLRAHALALDIRETANGRFRPTDREPLDVPRFESVQSLPDRHVSRVVSLLEDAYGADWHVGGSGDTLRTAIRRFKAAYHAGERATYDRDAALGYAIYHLPATYASAQYVLSYLGEAGRLTDRLDVLDVGAGVGGQALALNNYLGPAALIDYEAIEPSPANAELLEALLADTHRNLHHSVRHTTVEAAAPDGPYDLILLASVLSELTDPARVLRRLADELRPDGSIVAIAPADERTSRGLRRVETTAVTETAQLDVFAPTLRLWPGAEPSDACWSILTRPDLAVPTFQRKLDEGRRMAPGDRPPGTGEFVNVDVQCSFSILRPDGARYIEVRPPHGCVRLASSEEHVGARVDVAAVKLSRSLAEPDANPVFVIGDGSQSTEHFMVVPQQTDLNRGAVEAAYGDVLFVENGLILWNDDEEAINVVVDASTIVERVKPPTKR